MTATTMPPRGGEESSVGDAKLPNISWTSRTLHLIALTGLAVVQPLLSLLGATPDFWVARQATYLDVALVLLVAVVALPALILLSEWLVSLVNDSASLVAHLVAVAGLLTVFLVKLIDTITGGGVEAAPIGLGALVAAAVLVFLYTKVKTARDFLAVMAIGPVIFVAMFLIGVPQLDAEVGVIPSSIDSDTPVVFLALDEFQLVSIQDDAGNIDRARFPNFGRLEGVSTWYPNASTVHDNSAKAVPALLTGNRPEASQSATAADHPQNLFTVLGATHDLDVNEDFTSLCPANLCGDQVEQSADRRFSSLFSDVAIAYLHTVVPTSSRNRLPDISTRWKDFAGVEPVDADTVEQFEDGSYASAFAEASAGERRSVDFGRFLDALDGDRGATLYYLHVDLPHPPWEFMSSGQRYAFADWIPGMDSVTGIWGPDQTLVDMNFVRYMEQLAYTDLLVGSLLDRLEEIGLLESSLLIVTADHGVHFETGEPRRALTPESAGTLAPVPMFIKYPGQTERIHDLRNARTIDVMPTIVDVLGGELTMPIDGMSLLRSEDEVPTTKRWDSNDGFSEELDLEEYDAALADARDWFSAKLAEHETSIGLVAPGPRPDLIGREVAELTVVETAGTVEFEWPGLYESFDPQQSFYPSIVRAEIKADPEALTSSYAIAVDGIVWATIPPYDRSGDVSRIGAFLPIEAFQPGPIVVEVFGISDTEPAGLVRYS